VRQWWAKQAQRGGVLWTGEEDVLDGAHDAASSSHSDGMHGHNKGVEGTCAAKSPEHVYCQVVGVMDHTL
jgi:hypothetical protein